eukprot:jgi/Ulvmu1/10618/UM065_0075.1
MGRPGSMSQPCGSALDKLSISADCGSARDPFPTASADKASARAQHGYFRWSSRHTCCSSNSNYIVEGKPERAVLSA